MYRFTDGHRHNWVGFNTGDGWGVNVGSGKWLLMRCGIERGHYDISKRVSIGHNTYTKYNKLH